MLIRIFSCLTIIFCLAHSAFALVPNRGFLGETDGYLILTSEDDQLGADQTVVRSEFSIWRDVQVGQLTFEPFYYFKNESNPNSISDTQVTENLLGINWVVQQTDLAKISAGLGYKYRYKSFGDNTDDLLLTQFRMDF